jgi:uncharacterized membrane protein
MGKIFKRGLIAIAPLSLAIAIVVWLFRFLEDFFRVPIKWIIGEEHYVPGLGVLVAFVIIFIVGSLINTYIMQRLSRWGDRILVRIPFFKTFYSSIGDLMSYFGPKEKEREGKVVIVEVGGAHLLALVTREDFEGLPHGIAEKDEIAVFIPMSYQIGGFTLMISKSKVKPIDMSVEQGMGFVMTAGVLSKKNQTLVKNLVKN